MFYIPVTIGKINILVSEFAYIKIYTYINRYHDLHIDQSRFTEIMPRVLNSDKLVFYKNNLHPEERVE